MTEYRVVFTVLGCVEAENETEARELIRDGIENMPCVDYIDYRINEAAPFEARKKFDVIPDSFEEVLIP